MILQPNIALENNLFLIQNESSTLCFIVLGKNYLSYILTDIGRTKIYALKHYYTAGQVIGKRDFNEIFADASLGKATHFHVAVDTLKSVIIPQVFFDKTNYGKFFGEFYEIDQEETIEHCMLSEYRASLFALKMATKQFLVEKLKQVTFYDANACVLLGYPSHIIKEHLNSVFISVKDESSVLSFYQRNDLVLHQVVETNSAKDILYHVANAVKNFNIDINSFGIQLHGESQQVDLVFTELKKYYEYVRYCTRIKDLQYPDTLYSKPAHYFFNLFSLVSCES